MEHPSAKARCLSLLTIAICTAMPAAATGAHDGRAALRRAGRAMSATDIARARKSTWLASGEHTHYNDDNHFLRSHNHDNVDTGPAEGDASTASLRFVV